MLKQACSLEMDADGRLESMQLLVKTGEFRAAEDVGNAGEPPLAVSYTSLRFDRSGLLSEGAQASVFRADWLGCAVAIKKPAIREAVDLVRFRREVQLLSDRRVRHENIVPLIGARMLPPHYLAVFELFSTSAGQAIYHGKWAPRVADALMIGSQIALALSHLHSLPRPIVHRDVKPGNILLDNGRAVLGDFGIADYQDAVEAEFSGNATSSGPTGGFHKGKLLGTMEYMAPELLLKACPASPSSDVFALCVTINELLARVPPYSDCTRDNPLAHTILEMGYSRLELATAVAAEGLRPTVASGVPPEVASLFQRGWHADPSQRPSAGVIAKALHRLATTLVDDVSLGEVRAPTTASGASGGTYSLNLASVNEEWTAPTPPSWVAACPTNSRPSAEVPIGVFATSGARGDAMEDRGIIIPQVCMSDNVLVAGVFDGHRGADASEFLAANLERLLRKHWTHSTSPTNLLTNALLSAEDEYRAVCERRNATALQPRYPGSTACCMLLHGNTLTVANVGDSRAMICRAGRAIDLTRDHVAGCDVERASIEATGHAHLLRQHDGEWRIGQVGLAVTRSIGDYDAKPGLTAQPEVASHTLCGDDEFLVIATDGVWDVLSGPDVVSIIADTVKHPAMAAQRIVQVAVNERHSKDNATALVCFLRGQTTFERINK